MDNFETSGTKNIPTEEAELLSSAKPMSSIRVPPATQDLFYFVLDETMTQYILPGTDFQQQMLFSMLERCEMSLPELTATLKTFKQTLSSRSPGQDSTQQKAESLDYSVDPIPKYCLAVAALLFLVFFVLIILSSYYVDDSSLAYAAIAFVTGGLLIHLCVILFNGDFRVCRKKLAVSPSLLNQKQRRDILGAVMVSNKVFNKRFLNWKLGKDGNWLELSEMTLQRSVSVTARSTARKSTK